MQKNFFSFLLYVFITIPGLCHAAESYSIATFPIPLMVENETSGIFIDLTKEIAKRSKITIEIQVLPPKRTTKLFHNNKIDGFFPALDVMISQEISKSIPIYIKNDFAFTTTSAPKVQSLNDLTGKRIGITLGYPYSKIITANKNFTLHTAPNDIINLKKLQAGRIEAFIVEEKSGLTAIEQSGQKDIHYQKGKPLSKQDVFYAFQANESGKKLATLFSKALTEMKEDGTFAKIMSQAIQ